MTRRQAVERLISVGAASLGMSLPGRGDSTVRLTPLVKDIAVITGDGGNMLTHRSPEGLLLIDSGLLGSLEAVRFTLKEYSPLPVVSLINTHWHSDHTGGNPAFGQGGATIFAHKNCRSRLMTKQYIAFLDRTVPPLPSSGWPQETFETSGTLTHGDETVRYEYMRPAHTDGDITIHLPNANVLHCGDLFFNGMYPFIDYSSGGNLKGMVASAEAIVNKVDNDTTLIPGQGPVATKQDFQNFYHMMASVHDQFSKMIAHGKTIEEIEAAGVTRPYDDAWGKGMLSGSEWLRMLYLGETGNNRPDRLKG
jgi:cyclase